MRGYVSIDIDDTPAASAELEDLLDAAKELEQQLEAEPGVLLRQLTRMLKRQSEFRRLRDRFGSEIGR